MMENVNVLIIEPPPGQIAAITLLPIYFSETKIIIIATKTVGIQQPPCLVP